MRKTYCYKLYHSKKNKKLHRQIDIAGIIYNHSIALHRRYYRLYHKSLNKYQLQKHLAKLKKLLRYAFWQAVPAHAIQNITERIDRAYKLFFDNCKRKVHTAPPSFKKVRKYKSFTYNMPGKNIVQGNVVKLAGAKYKFFCSKNIEGVVKEVTVKRDILGDIYVYLSCEVQQNEVVARLGKSIGFDFGMKKFLTGSEEAQDVIAPLFFQQNHKALEEANRKLSRKQRGSHNRRKARLELARLHKHITNQRKDFHWKLAQELCGEYAVICLEDLNLKALQKRYGKKIMDYGFADFVKTLEYVASRTGTEIIKIDRYYPSSQICSHCGYQNKDTKNLSVREWDCPQCRTHHDRDRNAAMNILSEGLKQIS
jgi:putative transposase